jgi:hypothetical protein
VTPIPLKQVIDCMGATVPKADASSSLWCLSRSIKTGFMHRSKRWMI